ncbi:hypothetical protein [Bacillus testis]|nr:hypothetical protein [Bacillus testis]
MKTILIIAVSLFLFYVAVESFVSFYINRWKAKADQAGEAELNDEANPE